MLKKLIVKPLRLKKGLKLLEIGCGMGFHSNILSKMGFEVIGVDISKAGINYAKTHFPKTRYLHLDARNLSLEFEPDSFDIILSRGMSWYHYYLDGRGTFDAPSLTRDLFLLLRKGGIYILQIVTDFSGRRPDDDIHQNELKDYINLFNQFGEIILITNLKGNILASESDAKRLKGGINIATRK